MSGDPLTPLSALEKSMGLAHVSTGVDIGEGGIPDSDPDDTPPHGRAAVHYGNQGDALFSSPEPSPAAPPAVPLGAPSGVGISSNGGDGLENALAGLLGGVLGDDSSGAGGPAALIAQLEAMADDFERQSGEPELEIRGKIAMLRSVLDARPQAVAAQRDRMEAAMATLDADDQAQVAASRGEAAALQASLDVTQNIEAGLGRVDSVLRSDPEAAAFLSGIVSGAVRNTDRAQAKPVNATYEY